MVTAVLPKLKDAGYVRPADEKDEKHETNVKQKLRDLARCVLHPLVLSLEKCLLLITFAVSVFSSKARDA